MTVARPPLGLGSEAALALTSGTPGFTGQFDRIMAALSRCEPLQVTFEAKAYQQPAVVRAAAMWRARVRSEYESTTVFSQLALQTMEANAPADVTGVVLRMAQDELRHAQLCAEVVAALGDAQPVEAPRAFEPLARHPTRSAEERALRNIIYGCCLSETVNAARFVDALETISDPFVRETTRRLLADEVLHAQFGFMYLELWRDWLAQHPDCVTGLRRFLPRAFAICERELSGKDARFRTPTADEVSLGIPTPESLPTTFYQTVELAILPALDGFGLDATAAWRARYNPVRPLLQIGGCIGRASVDGRAGVACRTVGGEF